ncbi:MAG: hypothetical protein K9M75_09960 [Phycisphaerae bacterium]|nr:hypothetical protein [Phycisphaerae bacterium]
MSSTSSYLEIIFQLINGQQLRFSEDDPAAADDILQNIIPQKFFSDDHLRLCGESFVSGISKNAICWMVFKTHAKLDWNFPQHFMGAEVLTKERFQKALDTELDGIKKLMKDGKPGKPVSMFLELMMRDGVYWHLRIHSETLVRMEKIEMSKIIRELTGLHATGPEGGGVLINMNNVMSWKSFPGAIDETMKSWKMNIANTN